MKIDKIVIVGGGSAGWMTAAILIKTFPEKNIVLVESPKILSVGVGESTYDGINYYLEYLEIDRADFFAQTDATIKLAIEFKDFYSDGNDPSFIYPFGRPELYDTFFGLQDWNIKKALNKNIPVTDCAESYFPSAHLVKYKKMSDNENNQFDNFNPILDTALHFDAVKFATWLRDSYAIPRGVQNIVCEVSEIKTGNNGIEKIILENGQEIFSDLFIDCTGFNSLLISKTLKEKFISYNDVLPNTNAWATQVEYKNKEKEIDVVTKCTALKNGWCWNIPLWSRLGCGYVYSNKYVSHEDALKEFKDYLATKITINLSDEEMQNLSFKNIKMRVGIHERLWVDNVVAIGLSAGFIEPLESNGLFSVHEFLFLLIRALGREKVSQWDKDHFNYSAIKIYERFAEFIRIHYALSIRDDSNYWIDNMNRSYDIDLSRIKDQELSSIYLIQNIKNNTFNIPETGGLPWICAGMNYMLLDDLSIKLGEMKNKMNYAEDLSLYFENFDKKKEKWSRESKNSKSIYHYLQDKYYLK
jgi:flavin-dependent dehydrogenase